MAILWIYLLPITVFILATYSSTIIFTKDRKVRHAILKAGNIILSERDLQKRQDGKLVNFIATHLPKFEKLINLERLFGYDLKVMLELMGEKKNLQRVYADHIATALLASLVILLIPFLTGFWGYVLLYPISVMTLMIGQAQLVRKRFKQWQIAVIKDIPELIDKMRISLASGKNYIAALKTVQENSNSNLSNMLEKLINDMQIMSPTLALNEFANAFGLPVMVKFVAAIKVGIDVGYEQAESYFIHIEEDIRDLRQTALEELTRNKPEKVIFLKGLMILHALAALALTVYQLFSNLNKIF